MDLRRGIEFAFGSAVFFLGSAFLVLAFMQLGEPLVDGQRLSAPTAVVIPSRAFASPSRVATVHEHPRSRSAVASRAFTAPRAAATPQKSSMISSLTPSVVAPVVRMVAAPRAQERSARGAGHAYADRPAVAPAQRARVASPRTHPASERTPEPPIGYDDRPTLLRANGPGEIPSTAAPGTSDVSASQ